MSISAPQDETQLLDRAQRLAGMTLGALARGHRARIPEHPRNAKGWAGELLERSLGADAGSRPEPDFRKLGVELKTIPVRRGGQPRESTFVCVVQLTGLAGLQWETSLVRRKLARVLWVPVESEPGIALEQRRIGMPLLWSPSPEEEAMLRCDWEELMDMLSTGDLDAISARHGECLQIRPKGANARALVEAIGPAGERIMTLPRGFYLRARFTARLLRRHYALPA